MCLIVGCLWLREEFYNSADGAAIDEMESPHNFLGTLHPVKHSHRYVIEGDLLALSAALLYGLNDVLAEYFVKANNDRVEYLGMLGFFGTAFSFIVQVPLLEKVCLHKLSAGVFTLDYYDVGSIFSILCFIIMLCYFYNSVMAFLSVHDSTILNLSLQSCPLWAVIITMLKSRCQTKIVDGCYRQQYFSYH